jgi:3-phenylpropionate/trans-cinnamate dioxygenase ferredoxin subunit
MNGMHAFDADGQPLVLCHTADGWFAVEDACPHADARLHEGRLRRGRLVCPLHGAAFDVRDGRHIGGTLARSLTCRPVRVVDGQVEVFV